MSQVLLLVVFGGSIGQQQVELKDPTLLHQWFWSSNLGPSIHSA
jgi:hypothetical protein